MLLGGEIGPRQTGHAFISSTLMILGALITAVMFGEMAVLMSNLNRKTTKFQENQDTANTTMKNMKLPEELQIQISDYLIYTHNMLDNQNEYEQFENIISPSLKNAVNNVIYSRIIDQNEIFKDNPIVTDFITKKLDNKFVKPEKDIILQGDIGDKMYFLAKGECEVFVNDEYKQMNFCNTLKPGSHFGEVAIICGTLRTATVKAKNYSTVAELSEENFNELSVNFPEVIKKFKLLMAGYQDKWKHFLKQMLQRVTYLENKNDLQEEIVYCFDIDHYEPGKYIFQPGDDIDCLYFVTDGEVEISVTINDFNMHKHKQFYDAQSENDNELKKKLTQRLEQVLQEQESEIFDVDSKYKINEKVLKKKLKMLKPCTEIMPMVDEGKISSSCLATHISKEIQGEPLGKYTQEIVIDKLKLGSVLMMYNSLIYTQLPQMHILQCKSLKQSVIYSISIFKLEALSRSGKGMQLKHEMSRMRELVLIYDKAREEYISGSPILDYTACLSSKQSKKHKPKILRSMELRNKFKNIVLKVINRHREKSFNEQTKLTNLVKNLKFLLEQRDQEIEVMDEDAKRERAKQKIIRQSRGGIFSNILSKHMGDANTIDSTLLAATNQIDIFNNYTQKIIEYISKDFNSVQIYINKISRKLRYSGDSSTFLLSPIKSICYQSSPARSFGMEQMPVLSSSPSKENQKSGDFKLQLQKPQLEEDYEDDKQEQLSQEQNEQLMFQEITQQEFKLPPIIQEKRFISNLSQIESERSEDVINEEEEFEQIDEEEKSSDQIPVAKFSYETRPATTQSKKNLLDILK